MEGHASLYLKLTHNWHRLHSLAGVNWLEEHMTEACRRYVLHHNRRLAVENLSALLFVVINSMLFTVMRYLSEPEPGIGQDELVDALCDMISAYAQAPDSASSLK